MELPVPQSDAERGLPPAVVASYMSAVIDVRASEGVWTVVPLKLGEQRPAATFPKGARTISVATAYNPRGQAWPEHLNVASQQSLMSRLKSAGVLRLSGLARAANGSWAEPAVGMIDLPIEQAIAVSRTAQQGAFFYWTPGILSIVWTTEDGRVTADARYCRTIVRDS